jgi:hypothetical protein
MHWELPNAFLRAQAGKSHIPFDIWQARTLRILLNVLCFRRLHLPYAAQVVGKALFTFL